LQATCIVGAIAFTGIHQVSGNELGATVPDAMPEAAVSAESPGACALSAAEPEASAGAGTALGAELGSVPGPVSGPSLRAKAEIGDDSIETKSVDLGGCYSHHDAAQPVPTTRDASDEASNPAPVTQDFRYLTYYVWSELPPAEKPADIVLSSVKDTPVGTPVEEIKRASDAFGLDFNFMKAVARIESGFDPKQRTGSYIGLFQLSKYEFNKFGSGQILDPRDNAVAAAYKVITEGILFEWVTHKKPTLSDLYLIHQQGWEGAAEHIGEPDRIAWKSMCATGESVEKGEKWCKRAIWQNTLPAVKHAWKSVDKLTSGAFVGMWRERVAQLYSNYTAIAAAEQANQQISVESLAGDAAPRRPSALHGRRPVALPKSHPPLPTLRTADGRHEYRGHAARLWRRIQRS
jgi:Transglycosylase SLT domain